VPQTGYSNLGVQHVKGAALEHEPGPLPRYHSAFTSPRGTNLLLSWPDDPHAEAPYENCPHDPAGARL